MEVPTEPFEDAGFGARPGCRTRGMPHTLAFAACLRQAKRAPVHAGRGRRMLGSRFASPGGNAMSNVAWLAALTFWGAVALVLFAIWIVKVTSDAARRERQFEERVRRLED